MSIADFLMSSGEDLAANDNSGVAGAFEENRAAGPQLRRQWTAISHAEVEHSRLTPFFDDDEESVDGGERDNAESHMSLKDYWRAYAAWLECWPSIRSNREDQGAFARQWYASGRSSSTMQTYIVMAHSCVGLRVKATMVDEAKNGKILRPGQCVIVEAKKNVQGINFLKLVDAQGWVFESFASPQANVFHRTQSGGKTSGDAEASEYTDQGKVMAEALDLECGAWWYRIACEEFVEIRRTPTLSDRARSGWVCFPGEVVLVMVRCVLGGMVFLQLSDGRGWLFERKPHHTREEGSDPRVMVQIPDSGQGLPEDLIPSWTSAGEVLVPESGEWAYSVVSPRAITAIGGAICGDIVRPGDRIVVDRRSVAGSALGRTFADSWQINDEESESLQSRVWVRLAERHAWLPTTDTDGTLLLEVVDEEQRLSEASSPGAERAPAARYDIEDWMVGIC